MYRNLAKYLISFTLIIVVVVPSLVNGIPLTGNGTRREMRPQMREDGRKCYPELGCFEVNGQFFNPLFRPLNAYPADREEVDVRYMLLTRGQKTATRIRINSTEDLARSDFRVGGGRAGSKFIVHGFVDSLWFGPWMETLAKELLAHGDYNVFIVNWGRGSGLPYTQATANTRLVGAELALFIAWLGEEAGLRPADVHLVGHSLGAHTCGYAGERFGPRKSPDEVNYGAQKLGRITGLDPAQPYFSGMPARIRLDRSDADFVDVIHSDDVSTIPRLGLGMPEAVGHVDFYPNNGHTNPGCGALGRVMSFAVEGIKEGLHSLIACDHTRSIELFTSSINRPVGCHPLAVQCPTYELFKAGKCAHSCGRRGERCGAMGMRAVELRDHLKYQSKAVNDSQMENKGTETVIMELNEKYDEEENKFYLDTSGSYPYCKSEYMVKVYIDFVGPKKQRGRLFISLVGSERTTQLLPLHSEEMEGVHYPGAVMTYLITHGEDVGTLRKVNLYWEHDSKLIGWNPFEDSSLYVRKVNVKPLAIGSSGHPQTTQFCFRSRRRKILNKSYSSFDIPKC